MKSLIEKKSVYAVSLLDVRSVLHFLSCAAIIRAGHRWNNLRDHHGPIGGLGAERGGVHFQHRYRRG